MIGVIVYSIGMVFVISIAYFERRFVERQRYPPRDIEESFRSL